MKKKTAKTRQQSVDRETLLRGLLRERDRVLAGWSAKIATASMQELDAMILVSRRYEQKHPRPNSAALEIVLTSLQAQLATKYWEKARTSASTGQRSKAGLTKGLESRWNYSWSWMPWYLQSFLLWQRKQTPMASNNAMITAACMHLKISESTVRRYIKKTELKIPPKMTR